jgi:hypothetical protein
MMPHDASGCGIIGARLMRGDAYGRHGWINVSNSDYTLGRLFPS